MGTIGSLRHKWTEPDFRAAVASSESIAQVIRKLGLAVSGGTYGTIKRYIAFWGLDVSHFTGQSWLGMAPPEARKPNQKYSLETIFCEHSTYGTSGLLQVLLKRGLRKRHCESCKLTEWLGQPIAIEVDHANGVHNDHRLENLRLLCPNCHAQTPTWRGRANRRLKVA
jgi:hypothetical protein